MMAVGCWKKGFTQRCKKAKEKTNKQRGVHAKKGFTQRIKKAKKGFTERRVSRKEAKRKRGKRQIKKGRKLVVFTL